VLPVPTSDAVEARSNRGVDELGLLVGDDEVDNARQGPLPLLRLAMS